MFRLKYKQAGLSWGSVKAKTVRLQRQIEQGDQVWSGLVGTCKDWPGVIRAGQDWSGIVKLHSELALPTELQLDRVGVDFVFPRHN